MTKDKALALLRYRVKLCEYELTQDWPEEFRYRWNYYRQAIESAIEVVEQIDE